MYLKTQGLVLREVAYKDADKLLTVLTRDYGKMTLTARGVRRSGSPLKASCQLLACGEFTIFEYRGMSTINEAQTVELFPELRTDLELLSLALGSFGSRRVWSRRCLSSGRPVWRDIPRTWRDAGFVEIRSRTALTWKADAWSAPIAGMEMGFPCPSRRACWRQCITWLFVRFPNCFPFAWERRRFGLLVA